MHYWTLNHENFDKMDPFIVQYSNDYNKIFTYHQNYWVLYFKHFNISVNRCSFLYKINFILD
jgi:hypothetical protein